MRVHNVNQGYILLLAMAIAAGLSAVMTTFLSRTAIEVLAARRSVLGQQAFHLAEAGMDEALSALNADALGAWPACPGELPCREQLLTTLPGGEIRIRVFDDASPIPHMEVDAFIPTQANPSQVRRLEVYLEDQTAYFDHAAYNPRETPLMLGAITLGLPVSGRPYAGTGDPTPANLHVEVDAYHSALGPYDPVTNRSTTQASLATLAPATGGTYPSMFLDLDDVIGGDVFIPAATGKVGLHIDGSVQPGVCTAGGLCPSPPVTGAVEALLDPRYLPEVSVPASLRGTKLPPGTTDLTDPLLTTIEPGAYGVPLNLSGCAQPVELAGGDYRFDRISLTNCTLVAPPGTRIYLSAPANAPASSLYLDGTAAMINEGRLDVYFHGKVDFTWKAISPSDPATAKPSNLSLYGVRVQPDGTVCPPLCYAPSVYLAHGATLIGVIHNPEGSVGLFDDAQVFGSILAGRFGGNRIGLAHNSRLHYDLALKAGRLPIGELRYRLLSWREVKS